MSEEIKQEIKLEESLPEEIVDSKESLSEDVVESNGATEQYYGSKELNPDNKPLNIHNIDKYSKEQIDNFIMADPVGVFEERPKEEKKQDKPEDTKDEKKDAEVVKDVDKVDNENIDEDLDKFLGDSSLTKDEFVALNDAAKEKIIDKFVESSNSTDEAAKVKTDFDSYKQSIDNLLQDPIMSARYKEKTTGQTYIPKSIPVLTREENDKIDNAEYEDRDKIINELVQARVSPIVQKIFTEKEQLQKTTETQKAAFKVLKGIGEIDPEFSVDEADLEKINSSHKDWGKYQSGLSKIISYAKEKGENFATLSKKTSKEILAAYNAATGRSDDVLKKVANDTKKKILDKFKNPSKAEDGVMRKAKTLKGNSHSKGRSLRGAGSVDRESLVEQIMNGETDTYDVLAEQAAGDAEKTKYYSSILKEANYRRYNKQ